MYGHPDVAPFVRVLDRVAHPNMEFDADCNNDFFAGEICLSTISEWPDGE